MTLDQVDFHLDNSGLCEIAITTGKQGFVIFAVIEASFPRITIPYVNRDSARSQTIFNGNRRIDFSNTTGNVQSAGKSRWEF